MTDFVAMQANVLANMSDTWMIIALLIAAAVMFALEICTPTFGLLAIAGVGCMGIAVFYGFSVNMIVGLLVLVGCLIGTPAYLYFLVRWLPNTPLGKKMFLRDAPDATNAATPEVAELAKLIGCQGETVSLLRPAGAVRVDGERVIARAEQGMIAIGRTVKIIRVDDTEVIVREIETNVESQDTKKGDA